MALTSEQKRLLNNATPGLNKARLGDIVDAATRAKHGTVLQGAHVPNAAGASPTKAEFDALLASLRSAGVIASA